MLGEAVPAAFGAALYPPGLLFVAFLLVSPQPRRRALIFIAGAVIASLGVGFALVFILQGTGVERGPHRTVPAWVDLALGIVLLGSALYVWFRPPRGPKAAKERRELGLLGLLAIGLLMYSPSPLYLASLHAIAKAHESVLLTILSVLLVAAIYMLVIEIPVIAHAIWPEQTIRVVTAVNTWLGRYGRTIVVIAAGAFGIYLIISASVHLIEGPPPT
ncbi:GAP family protein [Actinomycetospora endophytica]|uniref:GAP family protein n=1 Tax=Actinomycetospora endophytica TaxID=2291215 RepID=A0ABS8PBC3_9PSEU|nr:GAP family protein [Actinomycetospora endophytica]MCD2195217.1 GAP family protein [Actinomycetospora endophytica]